MPRLYPDSNIISYLHHPEQYAGQEWYPCLLVISEYINNPANNIIVVYSPAHLMDVRRGFAKDQQRALAKLSFLSKLTNNTCILKDISSNKVRIEYRDATAFFSRDGNDFEEFLAPNGRGINLLSVIQETGIFEKYKNIPLNFDAIAAEFAHLDVPLPRTKEDPTLYSMMCDFAENMNDLFTNGYKLYKILRDRAKAETGVADQALSPDNPLAAIDEQLKTTEIGRRMQEIMKESFRLAPNNREEMLGSLFMDLDLLGFQKDKLSPGHGYMSVATDANHAFFASYCHIFVTQDARTAAKAEAVYKYLDLDIKVFDVPKLAAWFDSF